MEFRWKTQQPMAPQTVPGMNGGQAAFDASQAASMPPQGAPVAAEAFPEINAQILKLQQRIEGEFDGDVLQLAQEPPDRIS